MRNIDRLEASLGVPCMTLFMLTLIAKIVHRVRAKVDLEKLLLKTTYSDNTLERFLTRFRATYMQKLYPHLSLSTLKRHLHEKTLRKWKEANVLHSLSNTQ